jgi:hypothetical protein
MSCCKYVDDCLVVSEKAESILRDEIGKYWNLKESSIGKPKIYLGGKCREVELDNGTNCWAFGSSQYVRVFGIVPKVNHLAQTIVSPTNDTTTSYV